MKTIKINYGESIPSDFTGIAEYSNGGKAWIKEGKLHRENGPAIIYPDGEKHWYKEGKYHRLDGPAVEYADGSKFWFKEGKYHRLNGPAVEYPSGEKHWFKEGKYHRLDGPAVEYSSGRKYWYKEGEHHRIDGPAVEYPDGKKEWWIENNLYMPEVLSYLINSSFYLEKEKGRYNLQWLRFLTEEGIEEFPLIPGMKEYEDFKEFFEKLKETETK